MSGEPDGDVAETETADSADTAPELPGSITTVHHYDLPLPRPMVWERIHQLTDYRHWWSWLRSFDAAALAPGEEWHCEVQPPVPYPVRFRVRIEHVEEAAFVRARVLGDVIGRATLRLHDAPSGPGCVARLDSSLAPGSPALRLVSRFAAPIARFGHDWVLDTGARQFVARATAPVGGD